MNGITAAPVDGPSLLELMRAAYPELRRHARRLLSHERTGHTLQPTALANEVVMRMLRRQTESLADEAEVVRYGLAEMRSILTDSGRKRRIHAEYLANADGGGNELWQKMAGVLDLVRALDRLGEVDPRAREVAELRYLLGLTAEETAAYLAVSIRTVHEDWTFARAWLAAALKPLSPQSSP